MVGIISYGTYIPQYRIKTEEIARVWKKSGSDIIKALRVLEKSVPAVDEDAVTLAIEVSQQALEISSLRPDQIEVILVGSESHPYSVNPTSTIVGEFLNIGNNYLAADLEFACKAGTAGIQALAGLIASKQVKYGLVIGADTAQGKPHDALEYTAAAGSAALLLGQTNGIAKLLDFTSYSSDTPDFWRRDGIPYPTHAGRFSGEPAYFAHVLGASRRLMEKVNIHPSDINHAVFHMPNGKFPRDVARRLGFTSQQLASSLIVDMMGNAYSATSLLGFAAVLDQARPGEKIFMVSYGSGAGSDAFLWETTSYITKYQERRTKNKVTVKDQIEKKVYIDYPQYLRQSHIL